MSVRIAVHSPASPDALSIVDAGIDEFNGAEPALGDVRPLHVIATNEDTVIGGAVGRTWGTCCELQQLWVAAPFRNKGIGSRLLTTFEQEAKATGCTLIYLDTFSFQASNFYLAHGYSEVLRTTGFTGGVIKFMMRKHLSKA